MCWVCCFGFCSVWWCFDVVLCGDVLMLFCVVMFWCCCVCACLCVCIFCLSFPKGRRTGWRRQITGKGKTGRRGSGKGGLERTQTAPCSHPPPDQRWHWLDDSGRSRGFDHGHELSGLRVGSGVNINNNKNKKNARPGGCVRCVCGLRWFVCVCAVCSHKKRQPPAKKNNK